MMEKIEELEDAKPEIARGSRIRSYVLLPDRMVKDLRTRFETGDTGRVLEGDLDAFIKPALVDRKSKASEPAA